jgi:hypothetical protein
MAVISSKPGRTFAALMLGGLLFAGCSTFTSHFEPNANLARFKHIYVQQSLNDNHGLDILIVKELQARGIQAESGPLTLMPREVKAYMIYQDQWDWDFKNYLISLNISVREAATDNLLATAGYFRPTAFMKTPDFMVRTVLDGLLNPSAKSTSPLPAAKPAEGQETGGGRHRD